MNDLIVLALFAPIVKFLVSGTSGLEVPFDVLLWSVVVFIGIPLTAGVLTRHRLLKSTSQNSPALACASVIEGRQTPRYGLE